MSQPTSTVGTAVTGHDPRKLRGGPGVQDLDVRLDALRAGRRDRVSITNSTFSAACAIGSTPSGCGWLQKNPPHAARADAGVRPAPAPPRTRRHQQRSFHGPPARCKQVASPRTPSNVAGIARPLGLGDLSDPDIDVMVFHARRPREVANLAEW